MNVRTLTVSSSDGMLRQCDAERISRSFPLFLEKWTAFARFTAKN
ncbi:MAG: hypothetical protein BGO85_08160 [Enterobacter sp. 56-7]|nr:MAG: hypothetical protein BGO85_08160 [Enterobacter sp. 56-7]